MLRLEDAWIWDSWIADDGDLYHLFFLKAPRALEDAGPAAHRGGDRARDTRATSPTGTCTTDALLPAAKGWDDLALWTGSVVRGDDGTWRLFYTALSNTPGHGVKDQRIGMAESDGLTGWRRVGDRPLIEPDPRWYRTLADDPQASETWRDPFVFRDPDGDGWHMLITARAPGRRRGSRTASSPTRAAPTSRPGSCSRRSPSPPRLRPDRGPAGPRRSTAQPRARLHLPPGGAERAPDRPPRPAQHLVRARRAPAPARGTSTPRARSPPSRSCSPPRSCEQRDGTWAFVGFRNQEPEGILSFEILDPIPVVLRDGELVSGSDSYAGSCGRDPDRA